MKLFKKIIEINKRNKQYKNELKASVRDISIEFFLKEYPKETPTICLREVSDVSFGSSIHIPIKDWEKIKEKVDKLLIKEYK